MASNRTNAGLYNVTCRRPGGAAALLDFSMDIPRGDIHALVGEADSGEGTICRLLCGLQRPDAGEVRLAGSDIRKLGRNLRRHVRVVDQRVALVERGTVLDHFYLASLEMNGYSRFNRRRIRAAAATFLADHKLGMELSQPVAELPDSDRHFLEMVVAAYVRPSLLILDNSFQELKQARKYDLISMLKVLSADGLSMLIITPLLDEVLTHAETITIIRGGERVLSASTANLDRLMVLEAAYKQAAASAPLSNRQENDIFHRHMQYYIALLTNFPRPFIIVNNHLEVELMNQAARAFLGAGGPPYPSIDNMLAELAPSAASEILRQMRQRRPVSVMGAPAALSGGNGVVNIFSYQVTDGNRDLGAILLVDDVTEQTRMLEQMQLAEKVASLGILTAGMAHEINHPLATISNIVEYMKIKFPDPEITGALSEIHEEIDDISRIIRSLADFSRPERSERVDMHEMIRNLAGMVRHYSGTKRIALEVDLSEDEFVLRAGRGEMRQVLLNLLSNAFAAVEEGGTVRIVTSVADGVGYLRVADNGVGMTAETLKYIFLPFYSRNPQNGMGLGLYIAYNIIAGCGGKIAAASEIGGGTVFTLSFPLRTGEAPE